MAEKIDDKKIRELTVKKAETESDLEMTNKYAELFELYISVGYQDSLIYPVYFSHCARWSPDSQNHKLQTLKYRIL